MGLTRIQAGTTDNPEGVPSNSLYDALNFWQVDQNPNRETVTGGHQIHESISGWTSDDPKEWVVNPPVNIYDVGPRWNRIVDTLIYEPFTGSTFNSRTMFH